MHSAYSEHQEFVLFKAYTAAVPVKGHLNSHFAVVLSIDFCAYATYEQHLKGLLAIETDFLARTLEHMLHTIATMQKLPHLRSAQVRMFDRDPASLNVSRCLWKLHAHSTDYVQDIKKHARLIGLLALCPMCCANCHS